MEPTSNLVRCAIEAIALVDKLLAIMSKANIPNQERQRVALTFLFSSIAQSRSAMKLIELDPTDSIFAAFILMRSQIEHFLRGAFLAGPASDTEFQHFMQHEKLLPRGEISLGPRTLAPIVEAHFGWGKKSKLTAMVRGHYDDLNGATHGGRAMLGWYLAGNIVGTRGPHDVFLPLLIHDTVLAWLAMTAALSLAEQRGDESDDVLSGEVNSLGADCREFFERWNGVLAAAEALEVLEVLANIEPHPPVS